MACKAKNRILLISTAILLSGAYANAELKLPALISDHMVIQQNMPVNLWGWADAGAAVSIKLGSNTAEAVAGADGKWTAALDAVSGKGTMELVIESDQDRIVVKDVLIGEVWLGSGQSNMWWTVNRLAGWEKEIPMAKYPEIRLFSVSRNPLVGEQAKDCTGKWVICSPETVGDFSAVGYFFSRYLHIELNVPVGFIHSSVGGTPVESWTSRTVLAQLPSIQGHIGYLERLQKNWDPVKAATEYKDSLRKWQSEKQKAIAAGQKEPSKPQTPREPRLNGWQPASLYNGMIAPLIPYTIKGAIWYQGESNAGRPEVYHEIFAAMIQDWRSRWGLGDFPFYFVQLANLDKRNPADSNWAWLRDAQTKTLALKNTGMAVAIDIGEAGNIHPANKQDVGKRLALWALAKDYGRDIAYSGPLYKSFDVEDSEIRIHFDHVNNGFMPQRELGEFLIAGQDREFVPAHARIDGNTVVVNDPAGIVQKPVAVRYGWLRNPAKANLYNSEGLPASPFRTDDWPRK